MLPPNASPPADAAVLLVMMPPASGGAPAQAAILRALDSLRLQLGSAIQVLPIDEASHPIVVRSFNGDSLPCLVLVRAGVELWRQCGRPLEETIAPLLLSKLLPAPAVP